MVYYSTWQAALLDFTNRYGHNFETPYGLLMEFEEHLNQNRKGTYFIYYPMETI